MTAFEDWLVVEDNDIFRIPISLAPCSAAFCIPHLCEQQQHLPTVKMTDVEVIFFPLAWPSPRSSLTVP